MSICVRKVHAHITFVYIYKCIDICTCTKPHICKHYICIPLQSCYTHIYIYIYMHVCVFVPSCAVCIHLYKRLYLYIFAHIYIYVYTTALTNFHILTRPHTHMQIECINHSKRPVGSHSFNLFTQAARSPHKIIEHSNRTSVASKNEKVQTYSPRERHVYTRENSTDL